MRLSTFSLIFAAATLLPACKTAPKKPVMAEVATEEDGAPEVVLPDGVVGMDINGDGKPDIFKHYKVVGEKKVIVKRESDLNADGKIDMVRLYNIKAQPTQETVDLDFDGNKDVVRTFDEGKLVREAFDMNLDGTPDLTKFFEDGALIRKEQDSKFDGKVDYWEYFDEKGKLERIGVDHDGDGEIDAWHTGAQGVIADAESAGGRTADGKTAVDAAVDRTEKAEKAETEQAESAKEGK
jgi:hypothetical protein